MSYVILHACSYFNCDYFIDLEKNGNKFIVLVWNKAKRRTERRIEYCQMAPARRMFDKLCNAYGMTTVKEVEPEWFDLCACAD